VFLFNGKKKRRERKPLLFPECNSKTTHACKEIYLNLFEPVSRTITP
jgi:hypothetical protein